jgi:hypothetical protein
MKEAKSVHGEILQRERDDWRAGWKSQWPARIACVLLVLAILVGGMV